MAASPMSTVLQQLRTSALVRTEAGLTDGQLLQEFISRRDDESLAGLVCRHAAMVWGVCRRVLGNDHDAEDAFQATFLVLVRKAASVVPRSMVGNWLYGVAHQTARKARATAAKRRARERQVAEMPEQAVAESDLWDDLLPLLDQELGRLPDKYRAAIVLCDLEGKTRREAARQLGVPEGTLAARLARGRVLLSRRLARRGPVVSGGVLALALSQHIASASVPKSVVSGAIQAARLFAAGPAAAAGAIPPQVAALTEGVLRAMLLAKLKTVSLALLAAVVIGVGVCAGPHVSDATEGGAGTPPGKGQSAAAAASGKDKQPTDRKTQVEQPTPGVVRGVLDNVDAQDNVITVTLPGVMGIDKNGVLVKGKSMRLENLPVGKNTKITVNGKAGKLAEVNPKMQATLELEVTGGRIAIKGLDAVDAK